MGNLSGKTKPPAVSPPPTEPKPYETALSIALDGFREHFPRAHIFAPCFLKLKPSGQLYWAATVEVIHIGLILVFTETHSPYEPMVRFPWPGSPYFKPHQAVRILKILMEE